MRPSILATIAAVSTVLAFSGDAFAADTAPATGQKAAIDDSKPGNIAEISVGGGYFGGEIARGTRTGALEVVLSFRGGHYFGQHVGLVSGLDLGKGYLTTGCIDIETGKDSSKCETYSASVPLVLQYSFMSRSRGAWVEAGAQLGKTYAMLASNGGAVFVSPADATVGFGTRLPFVAQRGEAAKTLDFSARAHAGMFMWGAASMNGVSGSGEIFTDYRAMHYAVTLSMAYQF